MVHYAHTRHPAAIVDDLHAKVLREAMQNSRTTFSENVRIFYPVKYGKVNILHVHIISKLKKMKCIKILLVI